MSLRVYNSLTRAKEPFVPLATGRVGMYVCGVTVYDRSHVGHARSALVFDVIRRYLSFRGDRVHFVKNYTDVDDKIIARAARTGEDWRELTARYVREYEEDMQWLGVEPPTEAPRATGYVPQMQALIGRLLDAGVAYRTDGDVYFEVRRFPGYGRLSGRALDDLRAGARVEVDDRKRDPLDFALWKAAKPGEPWWDSPWGRGRPGWHVECSAMAMGLLGETFDVHGGGLDLVFPHHENEIAQSEAATGKPFARYWLHNGFVNVAAEKMSKSLGNILTIRELRDGTPNHPGGFDPEALRRYLIATHYRAPLDFWEPRIDEHGRALAGIRALVAKAFRLAGEAGIPGAELPWSDIRAASVECMVCERGGDDSAERIASAYAEFAAGMDDDFNTPRALAALHDLAAAVGEPEGLEGAGLERWRQGVGVLLALGRVLGLLWRRTDPDEFTAENAEAFQDLLRQREEARRRRDWARADAIREELRSQGVRIEDTPAGPRLRWSRETTGA